MLMGVRVGACAGVRAGVRAAVGEDLRAGLVAMLQVSAQGSLASATGRQDTPLTFMGHCNEVETAALAAARRRVDQEREADAAGRAAARDRGACTGE